MFLKRICYVTFCIKNDNVAMCALVARFDILTSYLNMEEIGRIMVKGAIYPSMIKPHYLKEALI